MSADLKNIFQIEIWANEDSLTVGKGDVRNFKAAISADLE